MVAIIDALINSLGELSKRKVKRSAHIWGSRLAQIYNRRKAIAPKQVPRIVRCIVDNRLESHTKGRNIIQHFANNLTQLETLGNSDLAALCYAFIVVGEDSIARNLLQHHCKKTPSIAENIQGLAEVIRTIALVASRQRAEKHSNQNNLKLTEEDTDICDRVLEEAANRLRTLQHGINTSCSECAAAGELLAESLFLSQLRNRSDSVFPGAYHWIEDAPIGSRVRISHLLSNDQKLILEKQIAAATYAETLSVLRYIYHMRHNQQTHLQQLFTRLCATTGQSTRMCRAEANETLDHFIRTLQSPHGHKRVHSNDINKALLEYLIGIRRSGVLNRGHVSSHRWNYPVMF
ncbi:uncharacterized protein BXIN_0640 [Babesia sp. Xinjiang]|uniref:uncharacterized protein n=1 Tax=Babesia sp. Xinjiang TaxID=462227 RepID=UPI000A2248DA|nr:uncharacterized protein BXIN_0640 [Babesia sp. Xinjiang]ORM41868.1 hypothetical protein BXIN_0640 [Babesia sp. Xinjiang]